MGPGHFYLLFAAGSYAAYHGYGNVQVGILVEKIAMMPGLLSFTTDLCFLSAQGTGHGSSLVTADIDVETRQFL